MTGVGARRTVLQLALALTALCWLCACGGPAAGPATATDVTGAQDADSTTGLDAQAPDAAQDAQADAAKQDTAQEDAAQEDTAQEDETAQADAAPDAAADTADADVAADAAPSTTDAAADADTAGSDTKPADATEADAALADAVPDAANPDATLADATQDTTQADAPATDAGTADAGQADALADAAALDAGAAADGGAPDTTAADTANDTANDTSASCSTTADCAGQEDGDLCNGTLYCDKSTGVGQCKVHPTSVVSCPASQDPCLQALCVAATGKCATQPNPDGSPCDDANAATEGDYCSAGVCVAGTVVSQCKQDVDCADAEDGNLCNGTLFCNKASGKCQLNPATVITCPTGGDSDCIKNTCIPATGTCQLQPAGEKLPCDDGNVCTAGEVCVQGACTPSADICTCTSDLDCVAKDDGNLCNGTQYCDLGTGECKFNPATVVHCPTVLDTPCLRNQCLPLSGDCTMVALPDGATCSDGNGCTTAEACTQGVCSGTATCSCDDDSDCAAQEDGNLCNGTLFCNKQSGSCELNPASIKVCPTGSDTECASTVCEPATGACVVVNAFTGAPCDADQNPCTKSDSCSAGVCQPGVNTCECLTDSDCEGAQGSNLCITSMYCDKTSWTCAPAQVVKCDTSLDTGCRATACDPLTGQCTTSTQPNGTLCGEGGLCSGLLICNDGLCSAGPAVDCSDANPCTLDSCEPATGCKYSAVTDGVGGVFGCDDGSACTSGDACSNGNCVGTLLVCDDQNACTQEACDPKQGCLTTYLDGAGCQDGNACSTGDSCLGGKCVASGVLPCADGNPCTADTCQPASGCAFPAVDGSCSDGNLCTTGESCQGGSCTGGSGLSCDDANVCTADSCLPGAGCQNLPLNNACSDGDACSIGDSCQAGVCLPGGLTLTCDDGNVCTDDLCLPASGCSFVANSLGCSDGDPCTFVDICVNKACVGTLPCKKCGSVADCDDANQCTDDVCSASTGCANPERTGSCSDGTVCTVNDTCSAASCTAGAALPCDDANACTVDSCDPSAGCQFTPEVGAACGTGGETTCSATATCVCPHGGGKTDGNCGAYLLGLSLHETQLVPAFHPGAQTYQALSFRGGTLTFHAVVPAGVSAVWNLAGPTTTTSNTSVNSGVDTPITLSKPGSYLLTVTANRGAATRVYTVHFALRSYVFGLGQGEMGATNPGPDAYGSAIAVNDTHIAVGGPLEDSDVNGVGGAGTDNSATDAGAVWVAPRSNPTGTATYFKAPSSTAQDQFGSAVLLCGDLLVVGAPGWSSGRGRIHAYRLVSGTWSAYATFNINGAVAGDKFGSALACVNGASRTIVASAPGLQRLPNSSEALKPNSGGAWVLEVVSGGANVVWGMLGPVSLQTGDQFGSALAVGWPYLYVGAPGTDGAAGQDTGAVWVYNLDTQTNDGQRFGLGLVAEQFGTALAATPGRLLVGAPGDSSGGSGFAPGAVGGVVPQSGAMYSFDVSATGPATSYTLRWKAKNPAAGAGFGSAVAVQQPSGRLGQWVAVGAPGASTDAGGLFDTEQPRTSTGAPHGAVWLYASNPTLTGSAHWQFMGLQSLPTFAQQAAKLGSAVAVNGDLLLSGAPYADNGLGSVVVTGLDQTCGGVFVCNDQKVCTTDTCSGGFCLNTVGASASCTDYNPCTTDTCQPDGSCTATNLPDATPCQYGNLCKVNASCTAGTCAGATDKVCDDGNACTNDSCDIATGACIHAGSPETCNGVDDDCDGAVDEPGSATDTYYRTGSQLYYLDADQDGVGEALASPSGAPLVVLQEFRGGSFNGTSSTNWVELLITQDIPAMALDGLLIGEATTGGTAKGNAMKLFIAGSPIADYTLLAGTILVVYGGNSSSLPEYRYAPVDEPDADWSLAVSYNGGVVKTVASTFTLSLNADLLWVDMAQTGTTTIDSWAWGSSVLMGVLGSAAKAKLPPMSSPTAVGISWLAGLDQLWLSGHTLTAPSELTPGQPNGGDNTVWVQSLRQSSPGQLLCTPEGWYTATMRGDCDDSDPSVFPGAPEQCNDKDDNCDGVVDEGCL